MGFWDYSTIRADNETVGEDIYIGPNMARNDVRPALQQLAADGKALWDYVSGMLKGDKGDPGGNVMAIGLFSQASSLSISSGADMVRTTGYAAKGVGAADYVYDAAVDAAYVAANPATSFRTSNGRGFKLHAPDYVKPEWFGPVGDPAGDDATFVAMRSWLIANGVNAGSGLKGAVGVRLEAKNYYLANTFDWKGCTNVWEGAGCGLEAVGGRATVINIASGKSFVNNRADTENGTTGTAIAAFGADGAVFRNIAFKGPGRNVGTAPVFLMRAKCAFYDCSFTEGGTHGLQIEATQGGGTTLEGNCNGWRLIGGACNNNGESGLAVGLNAAADTNAGVCVGTSFTGNDEYGIHENSFLGNRYFGIHCDGNPLGHVHQTNAAASCIFDGYYEGGVGGGYPPMTVMANSYITGPGASNTTGARFGAFNSGMFANAMLANAFVIETTEGIVAYDHGAGALIAHVSDGSSQSIRVNGTEKIGVSSTLVSIAASALLKFGNVTDAADDAAAAAASIPVGGVYRTGSVLKVRAV